MMPEDAWATDRLPFDARTFRASETEWQRVLSDVSQAMIRIEGYAGTNEVTGVGNVSLRAP